MLRIAASVPIRFRFLGTAIPSGSRIQIRSKHRSRSGEKILGDLVEEGPARCRRFPSPDRNPRSSSENETNSQRTKPCVLAQALAGRNTFQKRTLKRRYNPCRWEKPIRSRTTGHQGPERAVASRDGLAAGGHRAREGPVLFLPFGSGMLVIESGRLPPSAHHAHRPQSARGFRP